MVVVNNSVLNEYSVVNSVIFIKGVPTCERHSVEKDTHPVHPHLIVKRVYPDFNKASKS